MLKNPKAVIFDMDGVLLDTEPLHSKSLEHILLEQNKTPLYNDQGLLHTVGLSGDVPYIEFIKKYKITISLEALKRKRRKVFEKLINSNAVINEGILPLLKTLKKEKIKIGLASNRNLFHIHLILETLNIKHYFTAIVGPSKKLKHKPAPDIYLETARLLEVLPENTVVIEDSEPGVLSGKAAGMKIIAVPNQFSQHQNFSNATKILSSLSDINMSLLRKL